MLSPPPIASLVGSILRSGVRLAYGAGTLRCTVWSCMRAVDATVLVCERLRRFKINNVQHTATLARDPKLLLVYSCVRCTGRTGPVSLSESCGLGQVTTILQRRIPPWSARVVEELTWPGYCLQIPAGILRYSTGPLSCTNVPYTPTKGLAWSGCRGGGHVAHVALRVGSGVAAVSS